jgi:hypothetical protein
VQFPALLVVGGVTQPRIDTPETGAPDGDAALLARLAEHGAARGGDQL